MDNKRKSRLLRGFDMAVDIVRAEEDLIPEGMSLDDFSHKSIPYFKKYGFKVPEFTSELYVKAGAPESDRYISASLYYHYIATYLYNLNLTMAYMDKNAYKNLFPSIKHPETVVCKINNKIYKQTPKLGEKNKILSFDEMIDILMVNQPFIIKPTLESGGGRGVQLIKDELDPIKIRELINSYGSDFIVQKPVFQHPELSRLNESSLNTCRLYSYLPIGQTEYKILGATVRFGNKGDFRDNASAGGGFCKINSDGTVEDRICQFKNWNRRSLKDEKGIENMKFPFFENVKKACLEMHSCLPYLDLIGWDIAMDPDGNPVLIEFNYIPDCEHIQLACGPMFGEYIDDLMNAICKYEADITTGMLISYPKLSDYHSYNFRIGRKNAL